MMMKEKEMNKMKKEMMGSPKKKGKKAKKK